MKAKLTLILLAFAAVSLKLQAAPSQALPAPLPEWMNDAQAAQWSADQAAAAQTTSAPEPSTQFYTGKPYVADAGGYIFKYRTYNPEMSRWTSADPSGFPDGVNNHSYAPVVTSQIDSTGLMTVSVNNGSSGTTATGPSIDVTELGPTLLGGYSYYFADSKASTTDTGTSATGTLTINTNNTGQSWAFGSSYTAFMTPVLNVYVQSNGTLNYYESPVPETPTNGPVTALLQVVVEGPNTNQLTFRITAGWSLNATTVNGGGIGADAASISYGTTTTENVEAIGTFVFTE